jgi:hypothetical protein
VKSAVKKNWNNPPTLLMLIEDREVTNVQILAAASDCIGMHMP